MALLIRVVIISFPIIFAGALFWPVIHDRYLQPEPIADKSKLVDSLVLSEDNTTTKNKRPSRVIIPNGAESKHESDSGIYRWVDENGRVVFSDRPTNKNAVAHSLIEIGHISVVGVPRPQKIAAPKRSAITTKTANTKTAVRSRPDFKFSNTSAGQKHGYVLLSGRISRGYRCKQLKVIATATNDRGGFVRGSDTVKYGGSGSTLYEMKIRSHWNGKGRRPQWNAESVSAICLD